MSKRKNRRQSISNDEKPIRVTDDQIYCSIRKIFTEPKCLITWDRWDVWFWIKFSLGKKFIADKFWKHEVTGMVLGRITDKDLSNMGIHILGKRKTILTKVRERQIEDKNRESNIRKSLDMFSITRTNTANIIEDRGVKTLEHASSSDTFSSNSTLFSPRSKTFAHDGKIRIKIVCINKTKSLPDIVTSNIVGEKILDAESETLHSKVPGNEAIIIRINEDNSYVEICEEIKKTYGSEDLYYRDSDKDWVKIISQKDIEDVLVECYSNFDRRNVYSIPKFHIIKKPKPLEP